MTGAPPRIERATAEDVPALVPLVADYWAFERIAGFDPARIAAQLSRLFADPRLGIGWVALVDDAPAGYLLAVYVFSLEHVGLTAEIDEFFVRPPHRGRGVGAALLAAAEAAFVRAGCTSVSLQVSRGNDAARAFYDRQGYSERTGYDLLEKALRPGVPPAAGA